MATIKKALRFSWRGRRYNVINGKQSDYFNTPKPTRVRTTRSNSDGDSTPESDDLQNTRRLPRRSDRLTRSVRDAVGTLKQRFRMSTRRRTRLEEGKVLSPKISKRDSKRGAFKTPPRSCRSDVKLYSPFYIETPKELVKQRNGTRMGSLSVETPTRLKREVEALTANMQALSALTPTTLRERTRRNPPTSPLTNGSLKMRTARRRIETAIY